MTLFSTDPRRRVSQQRALEPALVASVQDGTNYVAVARAVFNYTSGRTTDISPVRKEIQNILYGQAGRSW
jgi:hypothetical protein